MSGRIGKKKYRRDQEIPTNSRMGKIRIKRGDWGVRLLDTWESGRNSAAKRQGSDLI